MQGETETDLKKSTLFNRAVAGINDTVAPKLLEAVEAGVAEEIESQCLAVTIKNVFGAPPPPEGTTGCGEDGECNIIVGYIVPGISFLSMYRMDFFPVYRNFEVRYLVPVHCIKSPDVSNYQFIKL